VSLFEVYADPYDPADIDNPDGVSVSGGAGVGDFVVVGC
jgi:hypothetical protein